VRNEHDEQATARNGRCRRRCALLTPDTRREDDARRQKPSIPPTLVPPEDSGQGAHL